MHFRDNRLPELFCGMSRQESAYPVLYPVACSPQAWASGSYFQLLQAILGLQPSAFTKELKIHDPHLPPWVERLDLRNLRVGDARLAVRFSRHAGQTSAHLMKVDNGPMKVGITLRQSP